MTHLSLTARTMLLTSAFLKIVFTLSAENPATLLPLICKI